MKERKCDLSLIIYELRNINGNLFVHFFGIIFPILLSIILSKAIGDQVPKEASQEAVTTVMLTMTLVMPMSIMLIGYGALYSQEVERGIPMRMHLFGLGEKSIMMAKIIAHLIFLTIAFVVFGVFQFLFMDIQKPALSSFFCLVISLYLLGILFLILAHAISNIFKKFGITFGIVMFLYFIFMILSGMMGVRMEQLPEGMQKIAKTLPMSYISNDFIEFWQGGSYNFMPFIQSFIFLGAVSGILLLYSLYKNRRVVK